MDEKRPAVPIRTKHVAGSGPGLADPEKIRIAVAALREHKAIGRTRHKGQKRVRAAK